MYRRLWHIGVYLLIPLILSSCASLAPVGHTGCAGFLECVEEPKKIRPIQEKLLNLAPPKQQAVVAIYNFKDHTGQR